MDFQSFENSFEVIFEVKKFQKKIVIGHTPDQLLPIKFRCFASIDIDWKKTTPPLPDTLITS